MSSLKYLLNKIRKYHLCRIIAGFFYLGKVALDLPECFLVLDDGVGELDSGWVGSFRSKPAEADRGLGLGILVGDGGLGMLLVTFDMLADGLVYADLSNEVSVNVVLAGVDEESLEWGLTVLGDELETEITYLLKTFKKKKFFI